MQQYDIPAADFRVYFFVDVLRGASIPVISRYVPHDRLKSELTHNSKHRRPPCSPRRTKQIRMLSYSVCNRITAQLNFFADTLTATKREKWMTKSMVPDDVPLFRDLTHNVRSLVHVASDQEKRCVNVMLGQDLKQL